MVLPSSKPCGKPATKPPILILSALAEVDDRINGLRAGGDDYLTKPFAFGELAARLDALVRRSQGSESVSTLVVEDLRLDLLSRRVTRAGKSIALQPRAFKLLEYLMRHADQGRDTDFTDRKCLGTTISIRRPMSLTCTSASCGRKIDSGFDRPLLHTIRGVGYRLGKDE